MWNVDGAVERLRRKSFRMNEGGVVISSLSRHRHMIEAAVAAQSAGVLDLFFTGLYYKQDRLPYRLVQLCPRGFRDKWVRRLEGRRVADLDPDLVADIPWVEPVAHRLLRGRPFGWVTNEHSRLALAAFFFERHVVRGLRGLESNVVHCLDGGALSVFREAQGRDMRRILDVVISRRMMTDLSTSLDANDGPRVQNPFLAKGLREQHLADLILVPSVEVMDSLVDRGVDAAKVLVVPFGTDTDRFRPNETTGRGKDGKLRFLFVGQLSERKGIHVILQAFKELNLADAELTVVGGANDRSAEALVQQYAGSYRAISSWPYSALHKCYQDADVFVFPSLLEGSALVTYEAMSSGLASIVTRESGSVARDGRDGLFVPQGDVPALKDAIVRLCRNRSLVREMGESAREYVRRNFSWVRYRERLSAIYVASLRQRDASPAMWALGVKQEMQALGLA